MNKTFKVKQKQTYNETNFSAKIINHIQPSDQMVKKTHPMNERLLHTTHLGEDKEE